MTLRKYNVPLWLCSRYNPGLALNKVAPGTTIRFPKMRSRKCT